MTMKCSKCKEIKSIREFCRDKYMKSGYHSTCKKCDNAQNKVSRDKRKKEFNGLYGVWQNMKDRCNNPNNFLYKRYGGRGIKVCNRWQKSFTEFYKWVTKNEHKIGLTIDRRDNDGNYCPGNCRFVTRKINKRNNSTTKLDAIKIKEIKSYLDNGILTQKEIGAIYNVSISTISGIKRKIHWDDIIRS